ncbi:MAG: outer membrane lipoprotein-sorting protein, partial [Candidatus Zixiibacteriota bacterium]
MTISYWVIRIIFLVVLVLPSTGLSEDIDSDTVLKKIVKKIDELYRSKSSYSEMEMTISTPHWERTLTMNVWTEGMEKTFIRILSPAKEKGIATLRIGNEMWNYLPKTNKVIKIPPSMMVGSWMGSDFTNDDLVKEYSLVEDYIFKLTTVEDADEKLLYVKLVPKEGLAIVWGHIIIAVRKSDYMPVWEQYFDERGNLIRLINFKDVKLFDDREIPTIMELIPQHKEGHKTIIRY